MSTTETSSSLGVVAASPVSGSPPVGTTATTNQNVTQSPTSTQSPAITQSPTEASSGPSATPSTLRRPSNAHSPASDTTAAESRRRESTWAGEDQELARTARHPLPRSSNAGHVVFDRIVTPVLMENMPINYKKERNVMIAGYVGCVALFILFFAIVIHEFRHLSQNQYNIETQRFEYNGVRPYPDKVCMQLDNPEVLIPRLFVRTIYDQYTGGENVTELEIVPEMIQASIAVGDPFFEVYCSPAALLDEEMEGTYEDHVYRFMEFSLYSNATNFTEIPDGSITLWVSDLEFPITEDSIDDPQYNTYHANYGSYQLARYEQFYSFTEVSIFNKFSLGTSLSGIEYSAIAEQMVRFERPPTEDNYTNTSLLTFYLRASDSRVEVVQSEYGLLDTINEAGGTWSTLVLVGTFGMFMYLTVRHTLKFINKRKAKRKALRELQENDDASVGTNACATTAVI